MRLYLAVFAESIYAPQGDENFAMFIDSLISVQSESIYAPQGDENSFQGTQSQGTRRINLCPARGRKPFFFPLHSAMNSMESIYAPQGDENLLFSLTALVVPLKESIYAP